MNGPDSEKHPEAPPEEQRKRGATGKMVAFAALVAAVATFLGNLETIMTFVDERILGARWT